MIADGTAPDSVDRVVDGPDSHPVHRFTVEVDPAAVADLRDRLARTRWPDPETVDDWSQGVPIAYLQRVCEYWGKTYDWSARVARFNEFGQFKTNIDGLDIHFIHARSPVPGAMPMILTHGWPGTFADFLDVVGPLTDPGAHGGNPADAFHVVCPSLPGYGFSGKPSASGWDHEQIARAWVSLMSRLGYERFVAQGGDWGAAVATEIAIQTPHALVGLHLTSVRGAPTPADRVEATPDESQALSALDAYLQWDSAYLNQQATRPQTVGYGLADSPAAQCAWILEKLFSWTDHSGDPIEDFGLDRLLDTITIYWMTNSGASSARLYWEGIPKLVASKATVEVPTGVSVFPNDIYRASPRWAARIYRNLCVWTTPSAGGHFAAWEQPDLFVKELRNFGHAIRADGSQTRPELAEGVET